MNMSETCTQHSAYKSFVRSYHISTMKTDAESMYVQATLSMKRSLGESGKELFQRTIRDRPHSYLEEKKASSTHSRFLWIRNQDKAIRFI